MTDIKIPARGVIKEQTLEVKKQVSIIYGINNSGKTSLLRVLNEVINQELIKQYVTGETGKMSVYIPTDRLIVRDAQTEYKKHEDVEDFIRYQQDSYREYDLHLKTIRDYLISNEVIAEFICNTVEKIFGIHIKNLDNRCSDGIENIINIYLCILFPMLWNIDINCLDRERFEQIRKEQIMFIFIDEIEMFLHVNIQEKLINSLKEDFKNCSFGLTTHAPLILTRYKDAAIYKIEEGLLQKIEVDLYYKDLDDIYEGFFAVQELPENIKEDINYLGRVIMNREKEDNISEKVGEIEKKMKKNYPNLFTKYTNIIMKAKNKG